MTKTVLFFPLNSPGHVNSSLGIADRLKDEHNYKTIFLLLGPPMGKTITEHGHELIVIEEEDVYEDYEISDNDDADDPNFEEIKKSQGKTKKKFPGTAKWPQLLQRTQKLMELEPLRAFIESAPKFEGLMVKELTENYDKYVEAIQDINPDLIVIDAYYIPPCIVKSDRPWVRLYSANPLGIVESKMDGGVKPPPMCGLPIYDRQTRDKLRNNEPEKWQELFDRWTYAWTEVVNALSKVGRGIENFLAEHDCPPLAPGQQAHNSPYLNLYMFPKALDFLEDDDIFSYPNRWLGCDSLVRKALRSTNSSEADSWTKRIKDALGDDKKDLVYFSLGSIASGNYRLMRRYIGMLEDDKERLFVVSKGTNGDKYELGQNMIGGNFIPQTFLLEQVSLAIIHGGNNSVTECLYYGIPMIVLPAFADQLDNAQRIQDLGLGLRLNLYTCTQDVLLDAINKVLSNDKMVRKAKQIGEAMRQRDDSVKATLIVKKLAEEGTLSEDFIEDCKRKSIEEIFGASALRP